jgi:nucleotide-binding universal stress UspA family protein
MVRVKNILCPVDFSTASLRAADYAIALASNYEANLHLFHVISPMLYSADQYAFNVGEIVQSMERTATKEMKKLEKKAEAAGVSFKHEIHTGDVESEIRTAIDATKADLLVMGTHGLRGLEKWFMGSVTEKMLRRSPIPMLTMRGAKKIEKTPPALGRILVTTDFSEGTNNALAYAFWLAQESQAKITLLHVISDYAPETLEAGEPSLAVSVRRRLEKMIPEEVLNWCDATVRVEAGNPYKVILKILSSEKIDLLVMNIHGKGMLDRALLGSTAERVVRAADCPVVLIPPMKIVKRRAA